MRKKWKKPQEEPWRICHSVSCIDCFSLCLFLMFSVLCHELWASKEAPQELAPHLAGACPTDSCPRASHPAHSLSSRSVPEPDQDISAIIYSVIGRCEMGCNSTLLFSSCFSSFLASVCAGVQMCVCAILQCVLFIIALRLLVRGCLCHITDILWLSGMIHSVSPWR